MGRNKGSGLAPDDRLRTLYLGIKLRAPYLVITSPKPQCGKSRMLEVLADSLGPRS